MTTTTQSRPPSKYSKGAAYREGKDARAMNASTLKAGLAGGMGLLIVLLVSFVRVPFPLGTCLVTLGFIVVWIGTGALAGLLAEDQIQTRRQAVVQGAVAGIIAGVGGGVAAMVVAALGALFPDLGEGVLAQFSAGQIEAMGQVGIVPEAIQLAGAVLSALLVCGIGGVVVSMIFGSLGGRIYFRLR